MAYIPNPNQSVSGTVGASIIGAPPANLFMGGAIVSTANPVPVQPPASGSLPITNVGSVITVSQGSVATVIIGGSIAASFTPPANQSVSGTVQTDVRGSVATVIIGGSIAASFTPPANQSVSGTVHVDNFSSVVAYQLAGSVLAVSGSFSPAGNQSVSGTVGASVIGHAPVVIVGGSIAASFTPPANQSVSGTVQTDVRGSVATVIIGGSIAASFTPPANQSVSGEVSVSNFPTTQNVSGSVVAFQGTTEWTVKSSIAGGIFPVSGSVAAFITNTNVNVGGSVVAFQGAGWSGSVAALVTNFPVSQNVSGSVVAFQAGTQSSSVYGMRNDAVASFLGADLTIRPIATDSAGRTLVRPFAAEEARIEGYISLTSTSVTTLVAAAGAGLRNYITDAWIANTGSVATLITFTSQGGASTLGFTIAPGGGGSNLIGLTTPIRTGVNETFGIQAGSPTSTLYMTVKGYKAP